MQELSLPKGEKMMAVFSKVLPGFDNASNLPRQVTEIVATITGMGASTMWMRPHASRRLLSQRRWHTAPRAHAATVYHSLS